MSASPLSFLRAGPPPPRVVLLPDGLFFVRTVPVQPGADGAEVAAQADLALEAASPFPLEQLYRGHFWIPGSEHALVFAAYRRRFTAEQTAAWEGAELVLPAFAAVLGAAPAPATSVVLAAPEGLTLVHWEKGAVPTRMLFQPVAAEATDEERGRAREALLRRVQSLSVVDLPAPPAAAPGRRDGAFQFEVAGLSSIFSPETAAAIDVRDREVLADLRRARRRDVILWRTAVGCLAACGVLLLGELALVGGRIWQSGRQQVIRQQAPLVDRITTAHALASYINDLSTRRLLPLEMLSVVSGPKPASVTFLSANAGSSTGAASIYTLTVEAQTTNTSDIGAYKDALAALPPVASADVKVNSTRNNVASLTLVVTFKPSALKPAAPPS